MSAEVMPWRLALRVRWDAVPLHWRAPLLRMAAAWTCLIAAFFTDWLAMARQWWDISTYNHILLIPVILGWLVWQRRQQLALLYPAIWWPGLPLVAAAAFLWLLGAFSGLDLARQAGAVAMLGASVPLLLGPRVTAGLWFPLCYMAFLVPVGEELVNVLQMITAAITIALTHMSGIPAVIEGVFIDTPVGLFEVAEACSGVKFLIAMVAFGVLMANVCFVSWYRRAALLAASVVVPILANGIRAWGTIYAAQIFGVEAAAGFDHIVYGWVFFAFVLALVIAGAWRFFDRPAGDAMIDAAAIAANPRLARLERLSLKPAVAAGALVLVVAGVRLWAMGAGNLAAPIPAMIDLPPVAGWQRTDYTPRLAWEPRASGAEHRLIGRYTDAQGRHVDVFLALYTGQGEDREAGGFGEGALIPDSRWSWQSAEPGFADGKGERLLGKGQIERVTLTWYHTGALTTGSNARLKLAVMADHLLLRARPTTMLILSAEESPGQPAHAAIRDFAQAAGPLDEWMDRVAAVR